MATNETFAVVGVSCSPRKDGNTDIMVQQVLRAAGKTLARVEFLRIAEMEITAALKLCLWEGFHFHLLDPKQFFGDNLIST